MIIDFAVEYLHRVWQQSQLMNSCYFHVRLTIPYCQLFFCIKDWHSQDKFNNTSLKPLNVMKISRQMMIVFCFDSVLPIITHIIIPNIWRMYVFPLPKINNPATLKHFRSISKFPLISKILETVVNRQLSSLLFDTMFSGSCSFRPYDGIIDSSLVRSVRSTWWKLVTLASGHLQYSRNLIFLWLCSVIAALRKK